MASTIEQFCNRVYKRRVIPISNGETHRIAYDDDRHDAIGAKVAVRIDAVSYGYLTTDSNACAEHVHCNYKPEPVNMVCRTDTPEEETAWHNQQRNDIEPKTVLFEVSDVEIIFEASRQHSPRARGFHHYVGLSK